MPIITHEFHSITGNIKLNATVSFIANEYGPQLASLKGGGWIAVWNVPPGRQPARIDGAIYEDDGALRVRISPINQPPEPTNLAGANLRVADLEDGGAAIVWTVFETSPFGNAFGVRGRTVDAAGVLQGGEFEIVAGRGGPSEQNDVTPFVTGLSDGGMAVTWSRLLQLGPQQGLNLSILNADGSERDEFTLVPADQPPFCSDLYGCDVAQAVDGTILIAMADRLRKYGLNGVLQWEHPFVPTPGWSGEARVERLSDGGSFTALRGREDSTMPETLVIGWRSASGLQQNANATGLPSVDSAANYSFDSDIAELSNGMVIVGWPISTNAVDRMLVSPDPLDILLNPNGAYRSNAAGITLTGLPESPGRFVAAWTRYGDVWAQVQEVRKRIIGFGGGETLQGGGLVDIIRGNGGADRIEGLVAADDLDGGPGDDQVIGGPGADRMKGGPGADKFPYEAPAEGGDLLIDFLPGADGLEFASAFGFARGTVLTAGGNFIAGPDPRPVEGGPTFLYNTVSGQLRYDNDGVGAREPLDIALLSGAPPLTVIDFVFN